MFALNNNNEDSNGFSPMHRESASQRAEAIFRELDRNGDGLVTEEDMVRFYMVCISVNIEIKLQYPGRNATTG